MIMRFAFGSTVFSILLSLHSPSQAEPFNNLDFEMAQIPADATWGDSEIPAGLALPYWSTNADVVGYHDGWAFVQSLRGPSGAYLSLHDSQHRPVLEGRFSLRFDQGAWIAQYGEIPSGARTLQYLRDGHPSPVNQVLIDGTPQIRYVTRLGERLFLERIRIEDFAGDSATLTVGLLSSEIDAITFSDVPIIPGDTDADGDVDTADLNTLVSNWSGARDLGVEDDGGRFGYGDTDLDRDIDSADLNTLITNWTGSQAGSASVVVVPEAVSPGVLSIICVLLLRSCYFRRK